MHEISKSGLAIILSKLKGFEEPKPRLEQYQTPSEIAAEICWLAYMKGDIEGKNVADLGCGTGILGIACLLLGAKRVYFIEIDQGALEVAKKNLSWAESVTGRKFQKKAIFLDMDATGFKQKMDTIVENPPFGVQKEHADRGFLVTGLNIANSIYSIHKTESKDFIVKLAKQNNFEATECIPFDFLLKQTMKHHTSPKKYIKTACFRLQKK